LEVSQNPIQTSSLGENYTLEGIDKEVYSNISVMKSTLKTSSSTAKVIAKLQECPCLLKCANEIQNTNYSSIDPLYSAKHEYAKTKIIDAIVDKYTHFIDVASEGSIPSGKLDILIKPGSNIILTYNKKTIAIELKTGKTADASMLFQIERYLPECDILIFVRILTEEVTLIERNLVEINLKESKLRLNRKINRLTNGELTKVKGEWCRGCGAECEYIQPSRWSGQSKSSLENFGLFVKNIDTVIGKILECLEKELGV
jgi:hypothetical protein